MEMTLLKKMLVFFYCVKVVFPVIFFFGGFKEIF